MLDGGSLLQRIPWTQGATYREICTVYTDYVAKKYGKAIVVFDGYGESSTKDVVHQRRAKGQAGVAVTFTEDMKLTMKKVKPEFLVREFVRDGNDVTIPNLSSFCVLCLCLLQPSCFSSLYIEMMAGYSELLQQVTH